jgi:hypothetical protein
MRVRLEKSGKIELLQGRSAAVAPEHYDARQLIVRLRKAIRPHRNGAGSVAHAVIDRGRRERRGARCGRQSEGQGQRNTPDVTIRMLHHP